MILKYQIKKVLKRTPKIYCLPINTLGDSCGVLGFLRAFRPNIFTALKSFIYNGPKLKNIRFPDDIKALDYKSFIVAHPSRNGFHGLRTGSGKELRISEVIDRRIGILFFLVCSGSKILSNKTINKKIDLWLSFEDKIFIPSCRSANMRNYFKKFYCKIFSTIWISEDFNQIEYSIKDIYYSEIVRVQKTFMQKDGRDYITKILQRQLDLIKTHKNI